MGRKASCNFKLLMTVGTRSQAPTQEPALHAFSFWEPHRQLRISVGCSVPSCTQRHSSAGKLCLLCQDQPVLPPGEAGWKDFLQSGARAPSSEEAENRPQTRPHPRAINGCKITHSIKWPMHKRNSFVKYKGVVWKSVFRVHDGCKDMSLRSSLNNSRKWRENILHHPTALPEVRVKLEPCLQTAYTISNRENEQSQS